ncbi:hypothetical protein HYV10_02330 [Candidatus Dependentiae bacterium]|nr:hypothetical protein [Candidatus Dependentiae bacterium]
MVKNHISLAVFVAFFAVPVFASSWISKQCPLNEKGQFLGAVAVVDYASSKLIRFPRAIEFYRNQTDLVAYAQNQRRSFLKDQADALSVNDLATVPPVKAALNRAATAVDTTVAPTSVVGKLLNTQVSVDLSTVGVDGGVTVKVVPLAAKVVATYVLIEAARRAVDAFSSKK